MGISHQGGSALETDRQEAPCPALKDGVWHRAAALPRGYPWLHAKHFPCEISLPSWPPTCCGGHRVIPLLKRQLRREQ